MEGGTLERDPLVRASATRPGWRPAGRRLAGPRLAQRRASGSTARGPTHLSSVRKTLNGRVFTTSSWSSCKSSTTVRSGPDRLRRRCRERDRRRRVLLAAYRDAGYVTVDLSDPGCIDYVGDSSLDGPDPLTGRTPSLRRPVHGFRARRRGLPHKTPSPTFRRRSRLPGDALSLASYGVLWAGWCGPTPASFRASSRFESPSRRSIRLTWRWLLPQCSSTGARTGRAEARGFTRARGTRFRTERRTGPAPE
jgi:hypothetical protein